jgi:hypothetical protein
MERRSVELIVRSLNEARVRYLVAGGLAVVAHGYVRFTADVDLLLDLAPDNAARAVRALAGLGYRPRAPVPIEDFARPEQRAVWMRDKDMMVFSLFSPDHPATEIDLFVDPPIDFERAWTAAARMEVAPGVEAIVLGRADLIEMKRRAGRPVDIEDARHLEAQGEPPS